MDPIFGAIGAVGALVAIYGFWFGLLPKMRSANKGQILEQTNVELTNGYNTIVGILKNEREERKESERVMLAKITELEAKLVVYQKSYADAIAERVAHSTAEEVVSAVVSGLKQSGWIREAS